MATPVVLTTGARPIIPVESGGVPMTPVDTLGEPVTVVDTLGEPVVLINNDGTPAFLAYSAKTYLGGIAPFHWADYINNRMLYAGADVGTVAGGTGYSFTRASDGYYTNSDGTLTLFGSGALRRGDRGVLIEGSRTNSVIWSQDFSNAAWTATGTTLTSGQADPAGGTAAFTLNGSGSFPRIQATAITTTAAAWTISVYVRRGGSGTIALAFSVVGGVDEVSFDLSAGTFGTPGANISSTGVQVLNANWWRIWAVSTRTATTAQARIFSGYPNNATPTVFHFQYELGAFPSSPILTTSAAATRASDVLSYTVNTTAQINAAVAGQAELVTNGGFDSDVSGWTLSGTTLPTWSAAGIVLTSDGSFFSRARQTFTTVSGRSYALSFNVVTAAASLLVDIGTTAGGANILTSGNLSTTGVRSFVFVAQGTTTHIELENGSTASPVIDNVSVKEVPANSLTLYPLQLWSEFERAVDTGGSEFLMTLSEGANDSNRSLLMVSASDLARYLVTSGGATQADLTVAGALALNTVYKISARTALNDVQMARGGTLGTQDTSASLPSTPTLITIGSAAAAAASQPFGYIRRVAIIQGAGTDAQLQSMTT